MIEDLFQKFEGAFAPNTIRAYKADFLHFDAWCRDHGKPSLPTDAETLANYVESMAASYKSATILRRLNSLSSVFRLSNLPNPTKAPEVVLAVKRILRRIGKIQDQARPLTRDILDALLAVCNQSVRGLRNQVLLLLGYETMRRRSEICSLRFEDLLRYPNGTPYLLLRFSKTDQYGGGKVIPISDELAVLIEFWRKKINASDGFILRSVNKGGRAGKSLDPAHVNIILRDLQYKAYKRNAGPPLSGHSFRVGRAIDLLDQGESFERIMLKGGWTSESTVMRYLRNYWAHTGRIPPSP